MNYGNLFFLLLILACPLMMIWMMRGHGHGGHGAGGQQGGGCGHGGHSKSDEPSVGELRRQRAELDGRIEALEQGERPDVSPSVPAAAE